MPLFPVIKSAQRLFNGHISPSLNNFTSHQHQVYCYRFMPLERNTCIVCHHRFAEAIKTYQTV
jgi:hypothetical protein